MNLSYDIKISSKNLEFDKIKEEIQNGEIDNAIIIDCGYNQDGQGDLSFIPENASYTPVPGGVGPVTTITLITNSLNLYHLFY